MKIKNKFYYAAFFSFLSLIATASITVQMQQKDIQIKRDTAKLITQNLILDINESLTNYSDILNFMSIAVLQHNGDIPEEFEDLSHEYMKRDPYIIHQAFAPDGKVAKITSKNPLKYNDEIDIFKIFSKDAVKAKETGISFVRGPIKLLDETVQGAVFIQPVFVPDQVKSENFWGFSILILETPQVFEKLSTKKLLSEGYDIRLIKHTADDWNKTSVMYETTDRHFSSPIYVDFKLYNRDCSFIIQPRKGWIDKINLCVQIIFSFVICSFSFQLAYAHCSIREKNKILEMYSYRDSLTSLYNHRKLEKMLSEVTKEKISYGIIFIDLDKFKPVNDTYGHETGNTVLSIIAKKISTNIKATDYAFRTGGDEFLILLRNPLSEQTCITVAQRIKSSIEKEIILQNKSISIGASIGWSLFTQKNDDIKTFIKKAEQMMYTNKDNKR